MSNDQEALAKKLCGTKPMSFSFKPDGSAIVINSAGQKCVYTVEQVQKANEVPQKSPAKPGPKPKK